MKRNTLLLVSNILVIIYSLYLLFCLLTMNQITNGEVNQSLIYLMAIPHLLLNIIGVICSFYGWYHNNLRLVLVSIILYIVAMLCCVFYFMFSLPIILLNYCAYRQIKKKLFPVV